MTDDSCTHGECARVQQAACYLARQISERYDYEAVDIASSVRVTPVRPWNVQCPDFPGEDSSAEVFFRESDSGEWYQALIFPVKNPARIAALEEIR
jgi:hypothetical protein